MALVILENDNKENPLANFDYYHGDSGSPVVATNIPNTDTMPDGLYKVTITGQSNNISAWLSLDFGTVTGNHFYIWGSLLGSVGKSSFTRVDKGLGNHITWTTPDPSTLFGATITFEWVRV